MPEVSAIHESELRSRTLDTSSAPRDTDGRTFRSAVEERRRRDAESDETSGVTRASEDDRASRADDASSRSDATDDAAAADRDGHDAQEPVAHDRRDARRSGPRERPHDHDHDAAGDRSTTSHARSRHASRAESTLAASRTPRDASSDPAAAIASPIAALRSVEPAEAGPSASQPGASVTAPAVTAPKSPLSSTQASTAAADTANGTAHVAQPAAAQALELVARELRGSTSSADVASTTDARGALDALAPASRAEHAAPAPAAETVRAAPAELPEIFQRLAVRVDSRDRTAVVELEPQELGALRIALAIEPDGHVRATVHAQRADGYAALEARIPELKAGLVERGFSGATVSLSLGFADERSRQAPNDSRASRSSASRGRELDARELRALAPSRAGAVDLWA